MTHFDTSAALARLVARGLSHIPAAMSEDGAVEFSEGVSDADKAAYLEAVQDTSAPPPAPSATAGVSAMAELVVTGEEITGFETAVGVGFGMVLDVGIFWLFFAVPEPDTSYIPFVQSPGFNVDVTDRSTDYFEVTVTDRLTGGAANPARLSISVQRIK
jgi:hypothetical protein